MPDTLAVLPAPLIASEPAVLPAFKRKADAVWTGIADGGGFVTQRVPVLDLTAEGIPGDRHGGFLREADARTPWYKRGEPIQNERHVSVLSAEDLAAIAADLGIDRIEPEWLGANLVVSGVADFSFLPRGTRLVFPSGAALAVSDQNAPCRIAGRSLAEHYPDAERLEFRFVAVAKRRRGVVARVERPGRIAAGEPVEIRVPEQWIWPH